MDIDSVSANQLGLRSQARRWFLGFVCNRYSSTLFPPSHVGSLNSAAATKILVVASALLIVYHCLYDAHHAQYPVHVHCYPKADLCYSLLYTTPAYALGETHTVALWQCIQKYRDWPPSSRQGTIERSGNSEWIV
jgi:hypothetical protein